jgi:4-amino-4-deoxy-L-arabinose transferase-like glycosyltransferase
MRGRDFGIGLSVFLGAIVVRLVGMAIAFDPGTGFDKFLLVANRLLQDGWLTGEAFAYSPAYVYFLAALIHLGAASADICLVQIVIGALTCVVIWDLTRRLFGRAESIVAGVWAAVYGPFILYSIAFESDVLGLLIYGGMAVAILAATDRPASWRMIIAGLLLGLRAIHRPNVLLLIPMLLIVWWLLFGRQWSPRHRAGALLAFCLAAFVPMAPIVWQNYRASGKLIPVMSSGGWVFYTSHNHAATGLSYYPPPLALQMMAAPLEQGEDPLSRLDDAVSRKLAGIDDGRVLSPAESSRFWFGEGLRSIGRRGWGQAGLQGRKLYCMFHGYEGHDNLSLLVQEEDLGWLTFFGMGLLAPFGIAGCVLACRSAEFRRGRPWVMAALIAVPVLSMSIFYVGPRFRLGLAAMLMPFAAFALLELPRLLRARRLRAAFATITALLVLGTLLNVRGSGLEQQARSRGVQLMVFRGARAATEAEARLAYESATRAAAYPAEAEAAYRGLALISRLRGEPENAERYGRIADGWLTENDLERLTSRRDDPDALFAVGRHFLLSGEQERAAGTLAEAARLRPDDPDLLFARAVAAFESRAASPEEIAGWTEEALRIGLRFSPNAVPAYVLAARCYVMMERFDDAAEALTLALRRAPDNEPARALLERVREAGSADPPPG